VGNGAAHLAFSRSISTWFQRRLGLALAFVMVGSGLGAMLLPVAAQTIITRSGWRAAYAALGGISLLLGLPLSWRYIRERGSVRPEAAPVAHSGMTWQQGLRFFPFWIIVAVLCVSSISMNGAITQMSALLTDRGITAAEAAICASILGGSSLFGRVGVGWLLDRFFGARVAFVISLSTASGIFLLARANSFPLGCLASALIGIGAGHYPLLVDALFRATRIFHSLWRYLDVLCRRGGRRSRDTRPRIRFHGIVYLSPHRTRNSAGAGSSAKPVPSKIFKYI
jgi:predicted MFS family arabinose efflux permease